jgi:hypothetical protein
MMDLKALPLLRKNLDAFIRADPVTVTLTRRQKIKTPAGGFTRQESGVGPQEFRLVAFQRRLYSFTAVGQVTGYVPALKYALIGRWDCDILRDDEFELNGDRYFVTSIEPKTGDRIHTDRVVAELRVEPGDAAPPVDPPP